MKSILIPASPGELLDKISILRLKFERIADPGKLENVRSELAELGAIADEHIPATSDLMALSNRLSAVNAELWDVEDALRAHEDHADFSESFVSLARSVYRLNDERAAVKRSINMTLGSALIEEKSYGSGK